MNSNYFSFLHAEAKHSILMSRQTERRSYRLSLVYTLNNNKFKRLPTLNSTPSNYLSVSCNLTKRCNNLRIFIICSNKNLRLKDLELFSDVIVWIQIAKYYRSCEICSFCRVSRLSIFFRIFKSTHSHCSFHLIGYSVCVESICQDRMQTLSILFQDMSDQFHLRRFKSFVNLKNEVWTFALTGCD